MTTKKIGMNETARRLALPLLLVIAGTVSLALLVLSWGRPLTDLHSFRQSQTAISVYWMLHGGEWLDYWTPVFGPPWSAPFEFPLYQWLTASLVQVTGLRIDDAGRLVSFVWLFLGGLPARALAKDFGFPKPFFPIFAVLVLASPIYAYWGRSFMIETQAVTLSLVFLLYARRAIYCGSSPSAMAAFAAGSAAALTKVTTALPFFLIASLMTLHTFATSENRLRASLLLRSTAVLLLPAVFFLVWNRHADQLKAANAIAAMTRSSAPGMVKWNFGTIDQRFGPEMLGAQIRAMLDLFGLGWLALLLLVSILFVRARPAAQDRSRTWMLLLLYLLPWMVFTNLHIKHDYYQTAIGLFAIGAVANALAVIAARQGRMVAILICGALVASQVARIATHHLFDPSASAKRDLRIASILKAETRREQLVMTYGLDWSPLIPYYAERKAAMEPSWTLPSEYRPRLPGSSLERASPAGAVVRCPSQVDQDPFARRAFDALAKNSRVTRVGDCKLYLQPHPSSQLVKAPVS